MSTQIKNYDNTTLTTLADNTLDTSSSSLSLPGTGYTNYGGPVLDNLVWIMQHFRRSTAPDHPVAGQMWYDTSTTPATMKLYDGSNWASLGASVGSSAPTNPTVGELWWDTGNNLLKAWDGSTWEVIGPGWRSNVNNAPDSNNTRILGNTTNRFNTVYSVNLDASGNLYVAGTGYVAKDLGIDGNLYVAGTGYVAKDLGIDGNLYVAGTGYAAKDLSTGGNLYAAGTGHIVNDLHTDGNLYVAGTGYVAKDLEVDGTTYLDGNLSVSGISGLGSITHVKITGGSLNQVITTNGAGGLTWQSVGSLQAPFNGGTITNALDINDSTPSDGTTTGALVVAGGVGVGGNVNIGGSNNVNKLTVATTATGTTPAVTDNSTEFATTAFVHSILPRGTILMWSGSIASIPTGWALCNGSNSTPNLTDRFVIGAGNAYGVGNAGGSTTITLSGTGSGSFSISGTTDGHTLTVDEIPSHNHPITSAQPGGPYNMTNFGEGIGAFIQNPQGFNTGDTGGNGSHSHTFSATGSTSDSVSVSGTNQLPPYYALAYIMKTTG